MTAGDSLNERWCIVVADDHGQEWAPGLDADRKSPVQYSRLDESGTLLERALSRARRLAPTSQILLTALEEHREYWEPAAWLLRPENRFVCDNRAASVLTAAAALLSIAAASPSHIVAVIPARCHVAQELILSAVLDLAWSRLQSVPEGVVTLGMLDANEGIDEDYIVTARPKIGVGLRIEGFARRPPAWVARHLRANGAMIASGIMIGYAGAFAAHITKHWPGLTHKLLGLWRTSAQANSECEITMDVARGIPKPVIKYFRWQPPSLSQRAFCVRGCGWSGLKSAHAVSKLCAYLSSAKSFDFEPLKTGAEFV